MIPTHQRALEAAKRFKQAEADLIRALQEVQKDFIFRKLGFTSLFSYCVEALGLSESTASNFVTVSRKASEIPALQTAILDGKLGVSKARKITPVLTRENQERWVSLATSLSTRKLEEEVANFAPQIATPERIKATAEDRRDLRVGISKALEEKLRRVQDLESQRTRKAVTLEEVLEALAEVYLEKKDPVRRADRLAKTPPNHLSKYQKIDTPASVTAVQTSSKTIPAYIKHQVIQRDQNQCTHIDGAARRCPNRRWIDIHHTRPRSVGGDHRPENLKTLCRAHHQIEHAVMHAQQAELYRVMPELFDTPTELLQTIN